MAVRKSSKKLRTKDKDASLDEHDGLEVTTEEDLSKMTECLNRNPIILAVIVMDGCHYCETIKPILETYAKASKRKIPMMKINRNVLSKTPFKDAKIDGFPSGVIYSPKDGSFGSFKKENGEETHAIPNFRDTSAMLPLLRADPSMISKYTGNSSLNSESVKATEEAEQLLERSGKKALKEKDRALVDMNEPSPPNTLSDTLTKNSPIKPAKGGSLLQSIMNYVEQVVPSSSATAGGGTRRRKRRPTGTKRVTTRK